MGKPPLQLFPNQGPQPDPRPASSKPATPNEVASVDLRSTRPSVASPREEEIRKRLLPIENQVKVLGLSHYLGALLFLTIAAGLLWLGYDDLRRPSSRNVGIGFSVAAGLFILPGLLAIWVGSATRSLQPWTRPFLGLAAGGGRGPWARSVERRMEEFLSNPEVDYVLSNEYARIVKLTPHIKKAYRKS